MAYFCGDRGEIKFFKRGKEKKGGIMETYIDE